MDKPEECMYAWYDDAAHEVDYPADPHTCCLSISHAHDVHECGYCGATR